MKICLLIHGTEKLRETGTRSKVAACHNFHFMILFCITSLPFTHIYPLQPVQGIHITHQKLFICFFIFFSTQNEVSQQRGKCIEIEYLHKYKLFVAYFVAFSRAGGREREFRASEGGVSFGDCGDCAVFAFFLPPRL